MIRLLILLFAAHALCDVPLQTSYISSAKRGQVATFPAWYALFIHSIIHAGAVQLITNNVACALGELAVHYLTDMFKCRYGLNSRIDQGIHLGCKILWAVIACSQ